MKKSIITLSAIAALSTASFANDLNTQMFEQIQALKAKIEALEEQMKAQQKVQKTTIDEKRIVKIEKKLKKVSKKANIAKAQSAGDNLKWNVDFRTQIDNLQYKLGNGKKLKNEALMTNRLWLGMKYQADENSIFYGTLSYNKVYGDNQSKTTNNSNFDWVTNESATNDNEIKLKEAYWLYKNDTFLGTDVPWTASVGRRPSTDGLGINFRANQNRKSALSHTVNVEFDGASSKFELSEVTGLDGAWIKFCAGRGLTNTKLRFSSDGQDYTKDDATQNIDMAGLIAVPYDDGQYSVHMNYAKSWNLIGLADANQDGTADTGNFEDFGDIQYFTTMFKVDGIGDGISDYLDNTLFFASYAQSKTSPDAGKAMLGSTSSETGHSFWLGVNAPCPIDPDNSKIGFEWNKGSKYWRPMTYGEDTMAGSKIAARGQAWEVYRHQQLTKALSFTMSYLYIDYDYTGSNGFFGDFGNPSSTSSAQATNAVSEAQDVKAYMRYKF
ncbi:DUF3373 family protein [Poseidonibacter lekithochrous]|uniref:DUF3373 family protein n=1 Tax=Poseidonibacter lekithochrous TaxID=1904463 RepID=UPI0008FC94CF|nr:DUF3373 family protein [Poseidonibacter lekithochrous]QKJ21568.1 DUF3373 domain-containing protein [Poseidonibacter lekithochrous]